MNIACISVRGSVLNEIWCFSVEHTLLVIMKQAIYSHQCTHLLTTTSSIHSLKWKLELDYFILLYEVKFKYKKQVLLLAIGT